MTIGQGSEVTTSPATLNFTVANWSDVQTVTLTAVEDDDAVTDAPTTLTHTASGADYDSVAVVNLVVTVTENDTVGLTLSATTLTVTEGSSTDTYTVVLDTEPTGPVLVTIGQGSEVTTSPATLNFTVADWSDVQTVTVTAAEDDDAVTDADTTLTHTASGADYGSVAVANLDGHGDRKRHRWLDAVGDYPDGDGRFQHRHLYGGSRHRADWPGVSDHRSR